MAEWEKEIAELKTDVRYIREDLNIMQNGSWGNKSILSNRWSTYCYMGFYENN